MEIAEGPLYLPHSFLKVVYELKMWTQHLGIICGSFLHRGVCAFALYRARTNATDGGCVSHVRSAQTAKLNPQAGD
jgi:hypothetical protein